MKKFKLPKIQTWHILVFILIISVVLLKFGGSRAETGCYIEDTTMTISAEEMFNPGITPDGGANIWINGINQGNVGNGHSVTVSPGDDYVVLFAPTSSNYYRKLVHGIMPCSGTFKIHEALYRRAPSLSLSTVINPDGSLNKDTQKLPLNAGQVKTVYLELSAGHELSIGNPQLGELIAGNVIACNYSDTDINKITIEGINANLTEIIEGKGTVAAIPSITYPNSVELSLEIEMEDTISQKNQNIHCFIVDMDFIIDDGVASVSSKDNTISTSRYSMYIYAEAPYVAPVQQPVVEQPATEQPVADATVEQQVGGVVGQVNEEIDDDKKPLLPWWAWAIIGFFGLMLLMSMFSAMGRR